MQYNTPNDAIEAARNNLNDVFKLPEEQDANVIRLDTEITFDPDYYSTMNKGVNPAPHTNHQALETASRQEVDAIYGNKEANVTTPGETIKYVLGAGTYIHHERSQHIKDEYALAA